MYLDTVHFEENWKERKKDALNMVLEFMKKDSWVMDGNYSNFLRKERLKQADYIIFLNFSRVNCLFRAFKRYFNNRNTVRESMAKGCIEKFDKEFILRFLRDERTKERKQHFESIVKQYKTKTVVIENQREMDKFKSNLFNNINQGVV